MRTRLVEGGVICCVALASAIACSSNSDNSNGHKDAGPADSGGTSFDGAASGAATGSGGSGGSAGTAHAGGSGRAATGGGANGGAGGENRAGAANGGSTDGGGTNATGGAAGASSGGTAGTAGNGGASGTAANGGASGTAGNGGVGGSMGKAEVRVVGRTDGDPSAPRFEWSGVSIQARFKGTQVTADLDGGDNNYFEIVVDGKTRPRVATTGGRKKVPIVSGLADAPHDLVIWRRTEADNSAPTTFYGLDFGGGMLLPITAPAHKLEVIGDSITAGYGDEGAGPNCSFTFDTENDYLAYGSVAARILGADLYTIAWSGKGVYKNYNNDPSDLMPVLYPRTIPTEDSSKWNFSWIPDAVVIDLGDNDFWEGDPGQPFVTAYEAFVAQIRTHYPNAYLFLVEGPMLSGDNLTIARGYMDQVVKARSDMGDKRVSQILVDSQDQQKNGIGCDYHPSVATHAIMGKAVAAAIKTTMKW